MNYFKTATLVLMAIANLGTAVAENPKPPVAVDLKTSVTFKTSNQEIQKLFDIAVTKARGNLVQFTPTMQVLVEGGGYQNAWVETQPMGGEMFARHNLQVAMNNQVIFMLGQRKDGRIPGMVIARDSVIKNGWDKNPREAYVWYPEHNLAASYEMFQGYCFPEPAWRMYFWAGGKDKEYLKRLYDSLEAHDAYLWRTRDSNNDGILETWCVWDTGEDGCTRLTRRGAPSRWPFEKPPGAEGTPDPRSPERKYWFYPIKDGRTPTPDEVLVPFASMDIMSYSYSGRAVLAKISRELGNGKEGYWRAQAEVVRRRLIDKLWVEDRHACFDLDRHGRRLDELIHNNLRCMWYGIFTQKMADDFVKYHLLNPEEFWTPVPLVSIAKNEPLFLNKPRNNWSGQPQGLTYQRAMGALENYGHYAEVTMLGRKLLPVIIRNDYKFTQQLDPVTGKPGGKDGYGPIILAALGYLNRMQGIHLDVEHGRVWWSGIADDGHDFTRTQIWGDHQFKLECKEGQLRALVDGKEIFTSSVGARIITDLEGGVLEAVGITPETQQIKLKAASREWALKLEPNQAYRLDPTGAAKPVGYRTAPFSGVHSR
ncbi:MAG: hypothetical protein KJO79_01525 [Verrucomicrobiae bacterium]|nr:hypothetical protein [Verrucomicrobiae bacterium]